MSEIGSLEGLRILLVEDELSIATMLREYLHLSGAEVVETASTLSGAMASIQEQEFDVAVLDFVLPDGNAVSFAETLTAKGVRIVFHSGHFLSDDVQATLPGATFAQKPCDPDTLIRAIAGAN